MREAGFYWIEWKGAKLGKDVAFFDGEEWFFVNYKDPLPAQYSKEYYNIGSKIADPVEAENA